MHSGSRRCSVTSSEVVVRRGRDYAGASPAIDELGIERLHVDYGGLLVAVEVAYDGDFVPVRLTDGHDGFANIIGELLER